MKDLTNLKNIVQITNGDSIIATSPFRNSKGKLDTYSLAEQLLKDYHVTKINCNNAKRREMLYIYNNGVYIYNPLELENAIRRYGRGAKTAEIKATIQNLSAIAPTVEETPYNFVAFNNCIVEAYTLKTFAFNPDKFVIPTKVYANYNINPSKEVEEFVDKFLDSVFCGSEEAKKMFYEFTAYCFLRTAMYQRAFILTGNASNGKSDCLYIITKLLGDYCGHKNLLQLSNLNNLRSLYQCTANVIDDVEDISRVDFSKIRTLISGNAEIAIQCTDEGEFAFEPYATLVLATTHTLNFSGCGDEIIRRFKVIPFEAKFTSSTVDRRMTKMITSPECLDVIATRAIQAVSKLGKEWVFPKIIEEATAKYFFEGNPILAFYNAHPIKRIITVEEYYRNYCIWHVHTFSVETDINIAVFRKRLNSLCGIKSKPHSFDGVLDTFYQNPEFNIEECRKQHNIYCQSTGKEIKFLEYIKYLDNKDV